MAAIEERDAKESGERLQRIRARQRRHKQNEIVERDREKLPTTRGAGLKCILAQRNVEVNMLTVRCAVSGMNPIHADNASTGPLFLLLRRTSNEELLHELPPCRNTRRIVARRDTAVTT